MCQLYRRRPVPIQGEDVFLGQIVDIGKGLRDRPRPHESAVTIRKPVTFEPAALIARFIMLNGFCLSRRFVNVQEYVKRTGRFNITVEPDFRRSVEAYEFGRAETFINRIWRHADQGFRRWNRLWRGTYGLTYRRWRGCFWKACLRWCWLRLDSLRRRDFQCGRGFRACRN